MKALALPAIPHVFSESLESLPYPFFVDIIKKYYYYSKKLLNLK